MHAKGTNATYRRDDCQYVVDLQGLGHVDLGPSAHEAGKHTDGEEHERQHLYQRGLFGVGDDPLRGTHVD